MNVIVYFSHKLGHNDSTIVNTFSINILHFKLMPLNQSWKNELLSNDYGSFKSYKMSPIFIKFILYKKIYTCCIDVVSFVHNLIMSRTIQLCLSGIDFWFLAISNSKWFSVLRFMCYKNPCQFPLPPVYILINYSFPSLMMLNTSWSTCKLRTYEHKHNTVYILWSITQQHGTQYRLSSDAISSAYDDRLDNNEPGVSRGVPGFTRNVGMFRKR